MPLTIWATHVLQWRSTKRSDPARGSKSQKQRLSSDCSLQPDYTKPESLVIANQHVAVNTFPGLVHTARHTMGVGNARSQCLNRKERAAEGGAGNWGEVVTRQPFENERLDHLLSKKNK